MGNVNGFALFAQVLREEIDLGGFATSVHTFEDDEFAAGSCFKHGAGIRLALI